MPYDETPGMAELRHQVDQAFADVRRAESVGPAAVVGLVAASLPLLMLLAVLALALATEQPEAAARHARTAREIASGIGSERIVARLSALPRER